MDEATFEARLHAELKRLFPTIAETRITHQEIFTLQLGRQTISVNGKAQFAAKGRLDVLVEIDDRPSVILELKRPGKSLTDEDRDQGISYARLMTPMPPLVVVSNGDDTEFYRSYDKERWIAEDIDEEAVQFLFDHALKMAAQDKDNAVMFLLGRNPNIWKDVILDYTKKQLWTLTGAVRESNRPLIEGFSIKRNVVPSILELLKSGKRLIVVTGPPLSGKTNVVMQVCMAAVGRGLIPLYLEAGSIGFGVIQHLANIFCASLFHAMTPEAVRQWLLNGLRSEFDDKLGVIVDGWSPTAFEELRSDVNDLLSLSEDGRFIVLLSVDENTYEKLRFYPGRVTETLIGREAIVLGVEELDDKEFEGAIDRIFKQYGVGFHFGSFYNSEYRQPRLLRVLLAQALEANKREEFQYGAVALLPSTTGLHVLEIAWSVFASDLLTRSDFKSLAEAHISDASVRNSDASLRMFSHGRGCVSIETAESVMGSERLGRLRDHAFISLINGPKGSVFVLPRVPEMLSACASSVIASRCVNLLRSGDENRAYGAFLEWCEPFPFGAVVGARAAIEMFKSQASVFSWVIPRLLNDLPEFNRAGEGDVLMTHFPDVGEIRLHFGKGMDEQLIGNLHPWLVLSHLAVMPMGDEDGSPDIYLRILATVGSFPAVLRSPDCVALKEIKGYHAHEIKDNCTVLCQKMGIIEPITHAMLVGFYNLPGAMVSLAKFSIKDDIYPLANRLYTAAAQAETCTEERVADAAVKVMKMLSTYFNEALKETFEH